MPARVTSRSERSNCWNCAVAAMCVMLAAWDHVLAAEPRPASVTEAAKVLDLRTVKLAEGATLTGQRSLAMLHYQAPGNVTNVFEFHKQQLLADKWTELPQGYVSEQSCSTAFKKDGYTLSMSTSAAGGQNQVFVMLVNHGNVDVPKLPVPPETKVLYGGPVSIMYVTDAAVEPTRKALDKLLQGQGWREYGTAGDVTFYKQNAIRLGARVSSPPAQQGKTVIDFQTEQMSADLPAPDPHEGLQYSDTPTQLFLDTTLSQPDLVRFYKEQMAKSGWKATTDNPIKISIYDEMIFRNPAMDMLTLEMSNVEGKTRMRLIQESAAEVAEKERLAKEELEARQKQSKESAPSAKVALKVPKGAEEIEQTASSLSFKLPVGKAKAAAEAIQKSLRDAGWKTGESTAEAVGGSLSLSKGEQQIIIVYIDPGIIPGEVTVTAIGVELEAAGGAKE